MLETLMAVKDKYFGAAKTETKAARPDSADGNEEKDISKADTTLTQDLSILLYGSAMFTKSLHKK